MSQGSHNTTTDDPNISIFPPSNPFSTPRSNTPEPTSSRIQPPQASSTPPLPSRTPRKGSFTEVLSPIDAPPAYTSTLNNPQSASPPILPQDVSPLQMPRRPSRSVSPIGRVPVTNHAPSQDEIGVRMRQHDGDPFMNSGRYEVPGAYARGNYGLGSYRHVRNYRARNILAFVVLVV